jgi:hypothetical protein
LTKLVETWCSRASLRQRRGRAGRTQPGECWKLFTRLRESRLPAHSVPEMLRTPLEHLVLQIRVMREKEEEEGAVDVKAYLAKAIEPPSVAAIDTAWRVLLDLGAVLGSMDAAAESRVTALGKHLVSLLTFHSKGRRMATEYFAQMFLPLDLRLGKVCLVLSVRRNWCPDFRVRCSSLARFSVVSIRCVALRLAASTWTQIFSSPQILTIAAALSSKPLFSGSVEDRESARQ